MHRLKSLNHLVQHNKQHHMKVLLSSFHLNDGHTLGFHPQAQKLEPPCNNKQHHMKVLLSSFHMNGHTKGFLAQLKS